MTLKIKNCTKQCYIELHIPGVADLSYPKSKTRRGESKMKDRYVLLLQHLRLDLCILRKQRNMSKIIQLGNLIKKIEHFTNPQCGRVYSIDGICPTLNTCQGGRS